MTCSAAGIVLALTEHVFEVRVESTLPEHGGLGVVGRLYSDSSTTQERGGELNASQVPEALLFGKKAAASAGSASLPWPAVVAAIGAILVALLNLLYNQWASRIDRRRNLYSEACKAAMSWVEMLYRVRRRGKGTEDDLVERFHTLQETIAYHEGWLATESPALARSYCKLIDAVRDAVGPLIKQAWTDEPRERSHQRADGDEDPDVQSARDSFLQDARDHLSIWPWVRLGVNKRNPKEKKS